MLKNLLPIENFKYFRFTAMPLIILSALLGSFACSRMSSEDAKKADNNPDTATVALNQPVQPAAPKPAMPLTDMPFEQLISVTDGLLDDFWRQTFQDLHLKGTYVKPKALIPYSSPMETGCGPALMGNAFYCPPDKTIYYDDPFIRGYYNDPGDYAAVTIFAHEWGHSIQDDLGIKKMAAGGQNFTIQTELQADCFAGAFAKHIFELGLLEEDDLDEGGAALLKVGDPRDLKWFDPQAHGKPYQRGAYFNKGWEGGVPLCLGE